MSAVHRVLRQLVLLGAGFLTAALLVAVGTPGGGSPGTATTASGPVARDVMDRGRLSSWCRERLASPVASAEFLNRDWWCAGRASGIWRTQPLDKGAACSDAGFDARAVTFTDDSVICAP